MGVLDKYMNTAKAGTGKTASASVPSGGPGVLDAYLRGETRNLYSQEAQPQGSLYAQVAAQMRNGGTPGAASPTNAQQQNLYSQAAQKPVVMPGLTGAQRQAMVEQGNLYSQAAQRQAARPTGNTWEDANALARETQQQSRPSYFQLLERNINAAAADPYGGVTPQMVAELRQADDERREAQRQNFQQLEREIAAQGNPYSQAAQAARTPTPGLTGAQRQMIAERGEALSEDADLREVKARLPGLQYTYEAAKNNYQQLMDRNIRLANETGEVSPEQVAELYRAEQAMKQAQQRYNDALARNEEMSYSEKMGGIKTDLTQVAVLQDRLAELIRDGRNARNAEGKRLTRQELQTEMTSIQEQLGAIRTALATEGYTDAEINSLFQYLQRAQNEEEMAERIKEWQANAKGRSDVGNLAINVGNDLMGLVGYADLAFQNALAGQDAITGQRARVDYNTDAQSFYYRGRATREGEMDKLLEQYGIADEEGNLTGMSGMGNFRAGAYNLAVSMGESTVVAGLTALGAPCSMLLLSGNAALQTTHEMHENGFSDGNALLMGAIAGAAEYVTEKIGMDQLFKTRDVSTAKNLLKAILKNHINQAMAEGSEEVLSTVINTLADLMVNKDKSELERRYRELLAQGMSPAEAEKAATVEWMNGAWQDFKGGFLSGLLFATGGMVFQGAQNAIVDTRTGKEIVKAGTVQNVLDAAGNLDTDIAEAANVPEISDTPSARELGAAQRGLERAQAMENMRSELEARGEENITPELLSALYNSSLQQEQRLTREEQRAMQGSRTAMELAAEWSEQWGDNSVPAPFEGMEDILRRQMEQKENAPQKGADQEGVLNNGRKQGFDGTSENGNDGVRAGEQGQLPGQGEGAQPGGQSEVRQGVSGGSQENLRSVTLRELGVTDAAEGATIQVQDENSLTGDAASAAQQVRQIGLEPVAFRGDMIINGASVNGYIENGKVFFRTDAKYRDGTPIPPDAIVRHESVHNAKDEDPGIIDTGMEIVRQRRSETEVQAMKDSYRETYKDLYDFEKMSEEEITNMLVEEIVADAYGGLNYFRDGGETVEQVRGAIGSRVESAQNVEAGTETRGPPRALAAGRNARTADSQSLGRAEEMEKNGSSNEEIRQETGWYRGRDGQWRFEVDDSGAKYYRNGDARFRKDHPEYARYQELTGKMLDGTITDEEFAELRELAPTWGAEERRLQEMVNRGNVRLDMILDHEALFEAYPELRKARVVFRDMEAGEKGAYDPRTNTITLSNDLRAAAEDTLLHEIQHAVQGIEGHSTGSSPNYWKDQLKNGYAEKRRAERIKEADRRYRELFDSAPEELKNKIRELNQAKLKGDLDLWDQLEAELYDGPYADLFSQIDGAYFEMLRIRDENREYRADELYRNTAGEIEARDAANRRTMTAEERKNTPPDLGDENTVFAEGPETSYALRDKKIPTREELEAKDPIVVVDIREETRGNFKEQRRAFLDSEEAQRLYREPALNHDTNEMLFITPASITHTFSSEGQENILLAKHLREIAENAVLTHGEQSRKAPDDNTTGVYKFFGAVQTNDGVQPVKLTVKEYSVNGQDIPRAVQNYMSELRQGDTFATVYDGKVLVLEGIEKETSSSAASSTQGNPAPDNHPSVSTYSIKDLLDLVKGEDQKYIPQKATPRASAEVDTSAAEAQLEKERQEAREALRAEARALTEARGIDIMPEEGEEAVSSANGLTEEDNAELDRRNNPPSAADGGSSPQGALNSGNGFDASILFGMPSAEERAEAKATEKAAKEGNEALTKFAEEMPDDPMDLYQEYNPVNARKEGPKPGYEKMSTEKAAEKKTLGQKISEGWHRFIRSMANEGDAIHQAGRKTGNKALDGMYFYAKAATQRAQQWIQSQRMSFDLSESGKGLNAIFDPIRAKGDEYYKNFQLYMYHMLNVERMSRSTADALQQAQQRVNELAAVDPSIATMSEEQLRNRARQYQEQGGLGYEDDNRGELIYQYWQALQERNRAEKAQNKPVFGWETGADESRNIARDLLAEHPEFEDLAQEIYDYVDALLQYRVDAGLITTEDMNRLKEMYPHYIPVMYKMAEEEVDNRSRKGNIQTDDAIKKAKGGDREMEPLHLALARQTLAVMRNAGYQQLGSEVMNEYRNNQEAMSRYVTNMEESDSVWDESMADNDDVNVPYENVISVFKDGKRFDLTLSDDMSFAFQSLNGGQSRQDWKMMQKANDLFKKLCTAWNPLFMITNPIRDVQDALFYSTDTKRWMGNYPKAISQIAHSGRYWQMYQGMGGVNNSYFDWATGENSGKMGKIEALNMAIEQAPRLAEFMTVLQNAERKNGQITQADLMEAFNAAAEITTNFGRSGTLGKWINRNLVPFWNPGVQGLSKAVRTATETRGFKAWGNLAIKAAALGMLPALLNGLLYRDDDEWDKIDDQMKMEYYLFKTSDGVWIKVPKGRVLAALSMPVVGAQESLRGDEVEWGELMKQAFGSVAPNNPLETNLLSQAVRAKLFDPDDPGKTWYGGNIESKRLQSYAPGERYDESTDAISKWLGGKLNLSPKKINYIIDQYSGVLGDLILPYLTPKAERGINADIAGHSVSVPPSNAFMSRFTLDTVTNNTISEEYYGLLDELGFAAKGGDNPSAIAERYMSRAGGQVSDIYAQIREIENDSELTDKEKTALTRELRKQLNEYEKQVVADAQEYLTSAREYMDQHPEFDYTDDAAVDAFVEGYNSMQTSEKYMIDADQAAGKMKDEVYREVNREHFGAEYALQVYNKDVYERARTLHDESGVSYDDYYDFYFGTRYLFGDKDAEGNTIEGTKTDKVVSFLEGMDITDAERNALYHADNHNWNYPTGITEYLRKHPEYDFMDDRAVQAFMEGYNSQQTNEKYFIDAEAAKGKMRSEAYREIYREQYGAEYALEFFDRDVHEKAQGLNKSAGLSYDDYYDFYFGTRYMTADKDEKGNSISGSKKEKVVGFINDMDITDEQKDALYLAAGYKENSLKTTPWNGGGGKYSGGSGGRGGGGGRKARAPKEKAVKGSGKIQLPKAAKAGGTGGSGTGGMGGKTDASLSLIEIIDRYYGGNALAAAMDGGARARGRTTVDFEL